MIYDARPDFETTNVPKSPWRKKFHSLVGSTVFEVAIIICIVLNMIQMALVYEGASAEWENILEIFNYIFTVIFIIEAILKLIAYGKSYFVTTWNKFDFIIVVSSIMDILIN